GELEAKTSRIGFPVESIPTEHPLVRHLSSNDKIELIAIGDADPAEAIGDDAEVDLILDLGDWDAQTDVQTSNIVVRFESVEERSRFALERLRLSLLEW